MMVCARLRFLTQYGEGARIGNSTRCGRVDARAVINCVSKTGDESEVLELCLEGKSDKVSFHLS